jgi:hypothetical protein
VFFLGWDLQKVIRKVDYLSFLARKSTAKGRLYRLEFPISPLSAKHNIVTARFLAGFDHRITSLVIRKERKVCKLLKTVAELASNGRRRLDMVRRKLVKPKLFSSSHH